MSQLYITTGTTLTQPNPTTLTTPNPYPVPMDETINGYYFTPSAAWIAQGAKAMIPLRVSGEDHDRPIQVMFVPSNPSATYTIVRWEWDVTANTWFVKVPEFDLNGSTYQGPITHGIEYQYPVNPPSGVGAFTPNNLKSVIYNHGFCPIYFQIQALSTGTLNIYVDGNVHIM